jgi:MOSC domain-containing protein YiiM
MGFWWRFAIEGTTPADLNRRTKPEVWSILEYGMHSAIVTAVNRTAIEMILKQEGVVLPDPPALVSAEDHGPMALNPARTLDDLDREGAAMASLTERRGAPWTNVGSLHGLSIQAEAVLYHAAHDASHHFFDIGRILAEMGAATPNGRGTVAQINTSDGGVPKRPVPLSETTISWDGLAGDVQGDRKHHGRPFQAVSLWSAEVIDGLAREGHPISAGLAGENLTVTGVDWGSLRPGSLLRAGTALLEISFPATPCHKQAQWFADGDFDRILHDRNPALTRWYAWVREPGVVRPGDEVVVQAIG